MNSRDDMGDPSVVRRVADELEIRNVVARIAHLADTAAIDELDQYVSLFTEDALWVVPAGGPVPAQQRQGHAEILEAARERRMAGAQGPGAQSRHLISTHAVTFSTNDEAQSHCYWQVARKTDGGDFVTSAVGGYRDTFVRTPQGWRLKRRELVPV